MPKKWDKETISKAREIAKKHLVNSVPKLITDETINEMINTNVREKFIDGYDYNKLCLHWYNIFKNLNSVESD